MSTHNICFRGEIRKYLIPTLNCTYAFTCGKSVNIFCLHSEKESSLKRKQSTNFGSRCFPVEQIQKRLGVP